MDNKLVGLRTLTPHNCRCVLLFHRMRSNHERKGVTSTFPHTCRGLPIPTQNNYYPLSNCATCHVQICWDMFVSHMGSIFRHNLRWNREPSMVYATHSLSGKKTMTFLISLFPSVLCSIVQSLMWSLGTSWWGERELSHMSIPRIHPALKLWNSMKYGDYLFRWFDTKIDFSRS